MIPPSAARLERRNAFDANLVFGVREFNLLTGRDRHLAERAQRAEDRSLIDPQTQLVRADATRARNCPLCGAAKATRLFVKDGFPHLRCDACTMVYVSPALREEKLHTLYRGEDSYTRVLLDDTQQTMDRLRFGYALDLVGALDPVPGRMLDVGCGPGTFLLEARRRGWAVEGVEWNSWCLERLGQEGIAVHPSLTEAARSLDGLRCVTAWSVLEHVLDPRAFLLDIRRILADRGLLLLMVPNVDSLLVRILHERAATFCGEMHVNFFRASTLARLLRETGFDVELCETWLTEVGTVHNWLSLDDPYLGSSPPVLEHLTPSLIHERMMGSQLFAIARAARQPVARVPAGPFRVKES